MKLLFSSLFWKSLLIITITLGVHGHVDQEIVDAVKKGDNAKLLDFLADINPVTRNLSTLLRVALSYEQSDAALLLIEKGADPNFANSDDGETPLITSSRLGMLSVCVALIEKGANLEAGDYLDKTALHYAAERHEDVVELLIKNGANVNVTDSEDWSPLITASYYGSTNIVNFLIKMKADINAQDIYLQTALTQACLKNHLEIIKILIAQGADANTADDEDKTPLMYAAKNGYLNVLKFLIENGANVNDVDQNGNTALHMAIDSTEYSENYPILEILVFNGADIDVKNQEGLTPLEKGAAKPNTKIFHLIKKSAFRYRMKTQFELLFQNERGEITKEISDVVTRLVNSELNSIINDLKEIRNLITANKLRE